MKLLIAYTATEALLPTLGNTLALQAQYFPLVPPEGAKLDTVVVTDAELPRTIKARSLKIDPWVNLGESRCLNLSKCRNVAIDFAAKKGCDWLILIDADTVLANLPSIFPSSGFAHLTLYRSFQGQTLNAIDFDTAPSQLAWFLLGKQLFERRFDERFVGYGLEEADFVQNVLHDITPGVTDLRAIHIWHEPRLENRDAAQTARNKAIFRANQAPIIRAARRAEAEARAKLLAEEQERLQKSRAAERAELQRRADFEAAVKAGEEKTRKAAVKTR